MAEHSSIEWTDATWNPITGCSIVSPGCTNCYAMKLAGTRLQHHPSRAGLTLNTKAGPVWNGQVRLNRQWLTQPLEWKRPRRVFVCAHGDLFHEAVPDEWIDQVFAVMALAPRHTFQVLTKRAKRMREWFEEKWRPAPAQSLADGFAIQAETTGETRMTQVERACEPFLERFALADTERDELWTEDGKCKAMQWMWPLPNVWLGVSAEDQTRAIERIPELLDTPAAIRFLSAEPLLGPIDLTCIHQPNGGFGPWWFDALRADRMGWFHDEEATEPTAEDDLASSGFRRLDWVIVGGESGHGARPMQPEWAESIRDQCAAAGVAYFFKQWGSHKPTSDCNGRYMIPVSKKEAGRLLGGIEHNGMPEVRR